MDSPEILALLEAVRSGRTSPEDALERLKKLPFEEIACAKVDHHRHLRHGIPEVIYAAGKQPQEVAAIARAMLRQSGKVFITRATEAIYRKLRIKGAVFHTRSGAITSGGAKSLKGSVLVLAAGTSDMGVAEEALVTARFLGSRAESVCDVGVAGIHRLLAQKEKIDKASVIIVVAGMEGALPSVVGGFVDKPVIAVPTSVGYGTSLGGLTALFAMLNSCVPGIAVMNIDNGFGAGCLGHRINMLAYSRTGDTKT